MKKYQVIDERDNQNDISQRFSSNEYNLHYSNRKPQVGQTKQMREYLLHRLQTFQDHDSALEQLQQEESLLVSSIGDISSGSQLEQEKYVYRSNKKEPRGSFNYERQQPSMYDASLNESCQPYEQQNELIKNLQIKVKSLKIDLKDMHSRLKRSEQIKDTSLKELERLECENHLVQDENKELKNILQIRDQDISTLAQQNLKLRKILKDKAFEENDFLLDIDEDEMNQLENSFTNLQSQMLSPSSKNPRNSQYAARQSQDISRPPQVQQQEQTYLEDIKKTLDSLNQLQSNIHQSKGIEGQVTSLRSAQEIALLKQRVQLLEQNNSQLIESSDFQKESYQKIKKDYEQMKSKYASLKEKHTGLKEVKERLDVKNDQFLTQINSLQGEIQNLKKSNIEESHKGLLNGKDQNSKNLPTQQNQNQVPPKQSLFDELQMFNDDNSLNFSNVVPFIKMLSPQINESILNNRNKDQTVTESKIEPKQLQFQGNQTSSLQQQNDQTDGDIAMKNNMLLNIILSKLNEVGHLVNQPSIPQLQQQRIDQDNSKQESAVQRGLLSPSHAKKGSSTSATGRSGGSDSHSGNNLNSLDLTGSVFPSIGRPKHYSNENDANDSKQRNIIGGYQNNTSKIQPNLMIDDQESMFEDFKKILEPIQEEEQHLTEPYSFDRMEKKMGFNQNFTTDVDCKSTKSDEESRQYIQQQQQVKETKKNMRLPQSRNSGTQLKSAQTVQSVKNSSGAGFQDQLLLLSHQPSSILNNPNLQDQKQQKSSKTRAQQKSMNTTILMRSSMIGNYLLNAYATNTRSQNE